MNRKLLVVAAVVVVGAGAGTFAFFARRGPSHSHLASTQTSEHGVGMDQAMAAVRAEYSAPEGSTPCASAYNAFKASQDYAAEHDVTPVVLRLAPYDEFLQRCSALPEATQRCLVPRYMARRRAECDKAKPPADALAPMLELKAAAPPGAPDPTEQWEAPAVGSP
ncbi:MAG TPA: hypothetical protein VIJ22_16595 [Polyangiaceae bacterium]